jgi:hypothetical protein
MQAIGMKAVRTAYRIVQVGLFENLVTLNEFLKTIVAEDIINIRMTNFGYFVQYSMSYEKEKEI